MEGYLLVLSLQLRSSPSSRILWPWHALQCPGEPRNTRWPHPEAQIGNWNLLVAERWSVLQVPSARRTARGRPEFARSLKGKLRSHPGSLLYMKESFGFSSAPGSFKFQFPFITNLSGFGDCGFEHPSVKVSTVKIGKTETLGFLR